MLRVFLLLGLLSLGHSFTEGLDVTWATCPNTKNITLNTAGIPLGPFYGIDRFYPTDPLYSSCNGSGIHFVSTCSTPGCQCASYSLNGPETPPPCVLQSYVPSNCVSTCGEQGGFNPIIALPNCGNGTSVFSGSSTGCQPCPGQLQAGMAWVAPGSCAMRNLSMSTGPPALSLPIGAPTDGVFYLGFGAFFHRPVQLYERHVGPGCRL